MKIVLLDEARRRFGAEDAWWRAHRDLKERLLDEFEQMLALLREAPEAGQVYRRTRGVLIRRVLMTATQCHVYYSHHPDRDLLEIHSLWGARRRRGPSL